MTRRRARRNGLLIGTPFLAAVVLPALAGRPAMLWAVGIALCLLAVAIAVHDLTSMLIPDRYSAGLALAGLLAAWVDGASADDLLLRLGGAVAIGAVLYGASLAYGRLRGLDGIGLGDVKLIAASAVLVGLAGIGAQILLATTAALAFVAIRSLRRRRWPRATTRIPFGAFLAPAAIIAWAWLPALG